MPFQEKEKLSKKTKPDIFCLLSSVCQTKSNIAGHLPENTEENTLGVLCKPLAVLWSSKGDVAISDTSTLLFTGSLISSCKVVSAPWPLFSPSTEALNRFTLPPISTYITLGSWLTFSLINPWIFIHLLFALPQFLKECKWPHISL